MADIYDESLKLCYTIRKDLNKDETGMKIDLHDKSLYDIVNEAKIFDLSSLTGDEKVSGINEEVLEEFYLPFNISAFIMSKKEMIVAVDKMPNQKGLHEDRLLVFFEKHGNIERYPNSLMLNMYNFNCELKDGGIDLLFGPSSPLCITHKNKLVESIDIHHASKSKDPTVKELADGYNHSAHRMIDALIRIVNTINRPDVFIMEKSRADKPKDWAKKIKRLLKRRERPVYTILKPNKIRKQMNLSLPQGVGTGSSKRPHDRRKHEAFLSHEKYRYDNQGRLLDKKVIPYGPRKGEMYYKKVTIPAVWVGPSENVVGKHRYRVLLNK